jgi:hypothetical protein
VREFKIESLTAERVALAYPLIRTVNPDLGLDAWCDYAEDLIDAGSKEDGAISGVLVATNEGGVIVGLVAYRAQPDLKHGMVLAAEHLLALDLLDRNLIIEKLAASLESLAEDLGIPAIHMALADSVPECDRNGIIGLLQAAGHHVESVSLCKPLARAHC